MSRRINARQTEAGRLRTARRIFERAMADNVTMAEARLRLSAEASALADSRSHLRQRAIDAIAQGDMHSDVAFPLPPLSATSPRATVQADDSNDGLSWWQR